jgi:hypothetical protein
VRPRPRSVDGRKFSDARDGVPEVRKTVVARSPEPEDETDREYIETKRFYRDELPRRTILRRSRGGVRFADERDGDDADRLSKVYDRIDDERFRSPAAGRGIYEDDAYDPRRRRRSLGYSPYDELRDYDLRR